jgi:hypothetical protein
MMILDGFHGENESENQAQISLCFWELPNNGNYHTQTTHVFYTPGFVALPSKAKDIVFRFILEYSSWSNFGP